MNFKEKWQSWINSTDDGYVNADEEEYDEEFDFSPNAAEEPAQPAKTSPFHSRQDRSNVVSINGPKAAASTKPKVVFQQIDSFDDVTKVADILKEKRIVVLNLETCPLSDAQRIIDVLYGVSYANDGDFKKVAGRAYIITPNNVPVTGELGETFTGADAEF